LIQTRNAYGAGCTVQLDAFLEFCRVDLRLSSESVRRHKISLRNMSEECGELTTERIRRFLGSVENPSTYNNYLKTLRIYFRDLRGDISPIRTFRFAKLEWQPNRLYSRKELTEFYNALEDAREEALFLMYATT